MKGIIQIPGEICTQLFARPVLPKVDLSGRTIIVTGCNVWLGKEAVKHFVRLGASKVIGTVRSTAKGAAALQEIEAETSRPGVAEMWELDYGRYESVNAFCARAKTTLDRLDSVVLNAGLGTLKYEAFEQDESTITVNVISTAILALLLLPVLRDSAARWGIVPTLTVTSSRIHIHANFPECMLLANCLSKSSCLLSFWIYLVICSC